MENEAKTTVSNDEGSPRPAQSSDAAKTITIESLATSIKKEIVQTIQSTEKDERSKRMRHGFSNAKSFSDLHDYCDANVLGESEYWTLPTGLEDGPEADKAVQALCDFGYAAHTLVDQWIKDGMPTCEHCDATDNLMTMPCSGGAMGHIKLCAEAFKLHMDVCDECTAPWVKEFGEDYAVPSQIQQLVDDGELTDDSCGNDVCPSFGFKGLRLWVDHPEAGQRELAPTKRFWINKDEDHDPATYKPELLTNNIEAVLAFILYITR